MPTLKLSDMVLPAYYEFWKTKKTYVVCKGARASGKSKAAALWHIYHMMKYPLANTLCIRKTERTLRDSVFSDLKWAMEKLGVSHLWRCTTSPLEMVYIPTGQKILFRGLDSGFKVTSISVPTGILCWLFIEEAYEINKEEDFDILNESIRGIMPDGYWKRVTVIFNPWNERIFWKKRFFDDPADDALAMTTTYKDNPYLSEQDKKMFEDMRVRNPRRYAVAGEGNWGIIGSLVYENWKEESFTLDDIRDCKTAFGLDFGYSVDATAFVVAFINLENNKIYIYDELYETKLSNKMIYERILEMGYVKEKIVADSAEPKSIDELKSLGIRRIEAARKGKDSINNGIQFIQNFEIIIHPRCVNFLTEISNYTWEKDKFGVQINKPIDDFNHCLDALRYGVERYNVKDRWLM